ncbi:uroporphyrinogen decarboxylase family protein [bacterium]|nr:uroporphyrinogen decarboxylase family protein [bacterium]
MSDFIGKQHVAAAFKGQFTDRVPFYPILGAFDAQLLPVTIKEFLTDSDKFAEAQLKAYELFKPDIIVMMGDLLIPAEALGNELRFPENGMCISQTNVLKDKANLKNLIIPDPESDGRMPYYIEACRKVKSQITDSSVGSVIPGPWTVAINIRDAEALLRDCSKDPDFVHSLMDFTTQVVKTFTFAIRKTGIGISFSEAPASCSLISPKIYREFIFPCHKKLISELHSQKIGVTLHVCGYAEPILEDLVNTGADAVSIDAASSLAKMMDISQKRTVIIGNIDTMLFYSGTHQQMEEAVKNSTDIAAKHGAYILSTGCEVPAAGTPEAVKWFVEAAQKYGTYR